MDEARIQASGGEVPIMESRTGNWEQCNSRM